MFGASIFLGALSAILIYMSAGMIFVAPDQPSEAFIGWVFCGGWLASMAVLAIGADRVSSVYTRGFFLLSVEMLSLMFAANLLTELFSSAREGDDIYQFIFNDIAWYITAAFIVCFIISLIVNRYEQSELSSKSISTPE